MQKLKWRVSFKNEMPATWTIWHLYKVCKIPARSSSRARFFNLAQAIWCISSNNEREEGVSFLEWNPSSLLQGWVLNLLVLSQFLGIQEEKLHHWWNQTVWLFFREADKETNVVLKCIYLIKWRKERNKNQFYKLICQKHEHRVFPLIPSPHMLALLDLPDLSSVAYTLKNWPNEMAFLV